MTPLVVTVIAPCRNERAHIDSFLKSVAAQDTAGLDLEVIVADGASDDGTRERLDAFAAADPRFRVVDNPAKIVSTGLNVAIREARGEVIVRLDVHCRYREDYIRRCVDALLRTGADNVGGPPRTSIDGFRSRLFGAAFHSSFASGGARWHDLEYEGPVDTVPFGCWRRSTFDRVGLFDETLVRNQDDEFNFRIIRAGGTVRQSGDIVFWYAPRDTLGGLFRQHLQYGFWKVAVIAKHGRPTSLRQLAPAAFVLANTVLPAVGLTAWAAGAADVAGSALGTWAVQAIAYVLASGRAAWKSATRNGWDLAPFLPIVFAAYHLSYGLGFLMGVARFGVTSPAEAARSRWFTSLTR